MFSIKKPPLERKWVLCPHCGAKVCLYDNTAQCSGVFMKCSRGCKREFELVVRNGIQRSLKKTAE